MLLSLALALSALVSPAHAQESDTPTAMPPAEPTPTAMPQAEEEPAPVAKPEPAAPAAAAGPSNEELARRVDVLAGEVERLRIGEAAVGADESVGGLGPAASKVYRGAKGVSLGGYGEVKYHNYAGTDQSGAETGAVDELDVHRMILYAGYKFNDRWVLNTEIEFEHVKEVYVEFAYLDFKAADELGVRAGLLLVPMGITNELHEPTTFVSVERPQVETAIIPTTWREIGAGLYGEIGPISYRGYLLGGMNAAGFSKSGLRGGRQKGAEAMADNFGGVVRVDVEPISGFVVGGSAYMGDSGQNLVVEASGEEPGVNTFVWEGHLMLDVAGLRVRALAAGASLGDVSQLNEALALTGADGVGEAMFGAYGEVGYDLFSLFGPEEQGLVPFFRYEMLNTQSSVVQGYSADPAQDQSNMTFGASWLPHRQITVKADYQLFMNEADTGVNQLNAGIGFIF